MSRNSATSKIGSVSEDRDRYIPMSLADSQGDFYRPGDTESLISESETDDPIKRR